LHQSIQLAQVSIQQVGYLFWGQAARVLLKAWNVSKEHTDVGLVFNLWLDSRLERFSDMAWKHLQPGIKCNLWNEAIIVA
jgi:hypothetical protein